MHVSQLSQAPPSSRQVRQRMPQCELSSLPQVPNLLLLFIRCQTLQMPQAFVNVHKKTP